MAKRIAGKNKGQAVNLLTITALQSEQEKIKRQIAWTLRCLERQPSQRRRHRLYGLRSQLGWRTRWLKDRQRAALGFLSAKVRQEQYLAEQAPKQPVESVVKEPAQLVIKETVEIKPVVQNLDHSLPLGHRLTHNGLYFETVGGSDSTPSRRRLKLLNHTSIEPPGSWYVEIHSFCQGDKIYHTKQFFFIPEDGNEAADYFRHLDQYRQDYLRSCRKRQFGPVIRVGQSMFSAVVAFVFTIIHWRAVRM